MSDRGGLPRIDGLRSPCTPDGVSYYARFFRTFDFDDVDGLLAAVAGIELSLPPLARCNDLAGDVMGGWLYWLLYIKGYLQYAQDRTLRTGNVYYEYLTTCFDAETQDPGLVTVLADRDAAASRLASRFADFDLFSCCSKRGPGPVDEVDPVEILLPHPLLGRRPTMLVYPVGAESPFEAIAIDGYHRLFLARLFRVREVPCQIQTEPYRSELVDEPRVRYGAGTGW